MGTYEPVGRGPGTVLRLFRVLRTVFRLSLITALTLAAAMTAASWGGSYYDPDDPNKIKTYGSIEIYGRGEWFAMRVGGQWTTWYCFGPFGSSRLMGVGRNGRLSVTYHYRTRRNPPIPSTQVNLAGFSIRHGPRPRLGFGAAKMGSDGEHRRETNSSTL